MTKEIKEILENSHKTPRLPPWPSEKPKKPHDKKAGKDPKHVQNTKYRLHVWYKQEYWQKGKNGKTVKDWFWNGIHLLEKFEAKYGTTFQNGELQAICWKLRQMYGRLERVVIYDKRTNRESDIAFEWQEKSGIMVNKLPKINWKEILE